MNILEISTVTFLASFIFALGGVGAAVVLIPVLIFLGVPFPAARSAGLFTNFISMSSAAYHNIKEGLVDFRLAAPIVIASIVTSPLGALISSMISQKVVGIAFTLFLFFAGIMVYTPQKEIADEKTSIIYPIIVGSISGFVSGFLGVGGGGVISPMLIIAGYSPKRVSSVTPFAVLFSSFTGFLAYWRLGNVDWFLTVSAAIPAAFAGYLGAYVTHRYLKPGHVKWVLGTIFFVLGIKFLFKFL